MPTGPTIVTGAAGFAGSHLLAHLTLREPVIAWDHLSKLRHTTDDRRVTWRGVDLLDRGTVRDAIAAASPAQIYHLAGIPHVGDSWQNPLGPLGVHVRGTAHILDAVRDQAPGCRVLVVSSGLVYRASDLPLREDAPLGSSSPYGFSKIAQDQLALTAAAHDGLDVVVARPFNHTGPRQEPTFAVSGFARQIARIERGEHAPEMQVGNLDARRDLTDVRDVARAYEALMAAPVRGAAFNVCSGVAHRIGDLLDLLIARSTVRITTMTDPLKLRPSDMPVVVGDPARIRQATGWTPGIPLERILSDVLDYWRQQP